MRRIHICSSCSGAAYAPRFPKALKKLLGKRDAKKADFKNTYVPHATNLWEDVDTCYSFFDAVYAGVKTLDSKDLPASDRSSWDKAAKFLAARR